MTGTTTAPHSLPLAWLLLTCMVGCRAHGYQGMLGEDSPFGDISLGIYGDDDPIEPFESLCADLEAKGWFFGGVQVGQTLRSVGSTFFVADGDLVELSRPVWEVNKPEPRPFGTITSQAAELRSGHDLPIDRLPLINSCLMEASTKEEDDETALLKGDLVAYSVPYAELRGAIQGGLDRPGAREVVERMVLPVIDSRWPPYPVMIVTGVLVLENATIEIRNHELRDQERNCLEASSFHSEEWMMAEKKMVIEPAEGSVLLVARSLAQLRPGGLVPIELRPVRPIPGGDGELVFDGSGQDDIDFLDGAQADRLIESIRPAVPYEHRGEFDQIGREIQAVVDEPDAEKAARVAGDLLELIALLEGTGEYSWEAISDMRDHMLEVLSEAELHDYRSSSLEQCRSLFETQPLLGSAYR